MNGPIFHGPVEALGDAVRLWLSNESKARRDAPEPDRVEVVIGRILRTVIHAQRQAATDISTQTAEFAQQSLCNRLEGGETAAGPDGMDADAAGVAMINCGEYPDPAVAHRPDARAISASILFGRLVVIVPSCRADLP
jgi:hypothetical protein